ncbi:MAG: DNA cytosine methyltransferase [Bryobacterales bacterium]|nr:DNA cytosine methyltransferase [Bryobacterales bacterium]
MTVAMSQTPGGEDQGAETSRQPIGAVDVFCGIGGLTRGLRDAGIAVGAGVDIDPTCRYAYKSNNSGTAFIEADIRDIAFDDLDSYYAEADYKALVGCAPCQPFSAHTRRSQASEDCSLVDEFARLIQEGLPEFVSMENVPGLAKHPSFESLLEILDDLKYHHDHRVLNFCDFGVPQRRRRLVMVASRGGPIALPEGNRHREAKVADYIRGLPPIRAGQTASDDPAHTTLELTPTNLARIRQSKPGGTWKDWDKELVSPCHTRTHYPAPYGRMVWDEPAPTITTQFCYYSTGRFGHPVQDRSVSVREAALLQPFPTDYLLVDPDEPLPLCRLARHVGNAVAVKIGELIGNSLAKAAANA